MTMKAMDCSLTNSTDLTYRRHNIVKKLQTTLVLWLDHGLNKIDNTYLEKTLEIRDSISSLLIFTEIDSCIEFIHTVNNSNKICMIVAGFLGQLLVPQIHHLAQVDSVFIFCRNRERHELWTKDWRKIRGIFDDIGSMKEALKQAIQQCEQNTMPCSFIKTDVKTLDQLDPSFMYTRILKDIMISMEFDEQHRQEYINYCRRILADNNEELKSLERFECDYTEQRPIWWYTYQCFLYPMLNRALRLMDGDVIVRMGFFISDLHRHIEELYTEQYANQYSPSSFIVYRGQGLSQVDFENLSKSQGGLISFNNFLSTSKRREISLSFAQYAATNPDLIGILFTMTIHPSQSTTPFACIREVSCFQTEDEVLFSMNTVFRINHIQTISDKYHLHEVMLTLTNDDDEDLCELTYSIRDEIPSCTNGWEPLALILEKIGLFDKAEEIYLVVLEQTIYELKRGTLYHALGRIYYHQGNYDKAIDFHERALQIYQQEYPPTSLNFFDIYNYIGMAYAAKEDHSNALTYFEKAIDLRQQSTLPDHPDIAICYSHIGNIYLATKDYSKALIFHEKALTLRQNALPRNHPDLSMCHNDIGMVYECINNNLQAYSYFERAINIAQHSLPSTHPTLLKYKINFERLKMKLSS